MWYKRIKLMLFIFTINNKNINNFIDILIYEGFFRLLEKVKELRLFCMILLFIKNIRNGIF